MAAGIDDRHRRKPLDAAPQGLIRDAAQNVAGEGLIDSSDEIRRVLLYIMWIIGVKTTGVEVAAFPQVRPLLRR